MVNHSIDRGLSLFAQNGLAIIIMVTLMKSLIILALVQVALMLNYNATHSQIFQRYTIIGHCTAQELTNWSCKACQSLEKLQNFAIVENKATSIMSYVGYSPTYDRIIIVFRGTIDVKNWIEDLSFNQVDYSRCKNCKIHEGFYLSYLSISDQLEKALSSLQRIYNNKQVLVIGASLGAALGLISGLQLQIKYGNIDEIHTFGCPRVGNQQFAMFLRIKVASIRRVVHNRDIVPHIPLQSQNFTHPPFEVLFDQEMLNYKICSETGEDPSCSNSFSPYFNPEDHVSYWTKLNVHDICS